jgi:hypothetical protein
VLLVTGARPGEITPAVISPEFRLGLDGLELHFCDLDARFPTIRVPRAKGDRGAIKRPLGRLIFLPSAAVETIRGVPRADGSIHAFPGDLPGEPIRRLEKAWGHLLQTAGLSHVPLKTTRPSWRTHAADCDIPPEHVQLLMGHAGLKITDTVYLKRIAPSLSASAQKVGAYIWSLLNCPGVGRLHGRVTAKLLRLPAPERAAQELRRPRRADAADQRWDRFLLGDLDDDARLAEPVLAEGAPW